MTATNANIPMDVVQEVSTLGVDADEDTISGNEEEDFPSASENVAAQDVVTPLGDMFVSQSAALFDPSAVYFF